MDWFLESIYPTLIFGVLAGTLCAVLLVQTGRKAFAVALVGVAVVSGLLLLLEQAVVTEREEVENTVDALAAALESNEIPRVRSFLSGVPEAAAMHQQAEHALTQFRVTKAKVREIKVLVRRQAGEAIAEFDGIVNGESKVSGFAGSGVFAQRFTVYFRREPEPAGPYKAYKFEQKDMLGR